MLTATSLLVTLALGARTAPAVHRVFEASYSDRLVPLLSEVVRFQTVAGNDAAFAEQRAWLHGVAPTLGLEVHDAETMIEIELPGPPGAPVLGLIVHGDVQPVDAREWSAPPFSGLVRDGRVWGRGTADDKGPLVQALLAMAALRSSGVRRTQTVRLIVGTTEESGSKDTEVYLASHAPPDVSLVLDSAFPVVVGEKAWNGLVVTAPPPRTPAAAATDAPFEVTSLEAGIGASIVPDRASLGLRWVRGAPEWEPFLAKIRARPLPEGTRLDVQGEGAERTLVAHGRSAHAGVALRSGRNALVALAAATEGLLPPCGATDLLAFAREAGASLDGTGLGLPVAPPPWNGFETNVAMVKPAADGALALTINVRAGPGLYGAALKAHLEERVRSFDARTGAALSASGIFRDEPLVFDPQSRIVKRLLAAYRRATGRRDARPVVSAGGTYAKRFPRAIPYGMWFEDAPYPGHAADEYAPVADLRRGTRALIEVLADLACGPRLERPFER
jgi:succinyl-diaminopimelate desuccinylase